MKTVIFVMMILICFNYILKQTYRKIYSVIFSATVCALFTGSMWTHAIEQSKSQISVWLSDTSLMLDLAVILTLEVAVQMAFCILSANIQTSGTEKPLMIWGYRALRWFPGVLVFPVLYSILVSVIFVMPGISFSLIAWSLAAVIFFAFLFGTYIVKRILPEKELRLELLFLSNALIAILGVIATVNGRTAVAGSNEVNWRSLAVVSALVGAGIIGGMVMNKIKHSKK